MPIFCPSGHLILDESRCPVCGWIQPLPASVGTLVWGPLKITPNLGGPGTDAYFHADIHEGVVVFGHKQQLMGLCLSDGRELWRRELPSNLEAGGLVRGFVQNQSQLLISLCDHRPLLEAQSGELAVIDPATGTTRTLWKPNCPDLGLPVFDEGIMAVRTSRPELALFATPYGLDQRWRIPLETWWPSTPLIAGQAVIVSDGQVMSQIGYLCAYDTADGKLLWKTSLPSGLMAHPPVYDQGMVVGRLKNEAGKHALRAYRVQDGSPAWQVEFKSLYSPPLATNGLVYIVQRGSSKREAADHYQLVALDVQTGDQRWCENLNGRRVRRIHALEDGTLILVSDDGNISGWDAVEHCLLWQVQVGNRDNPPQTVPASSQGLMVMGTYFGDVAAIKVHEPQRLEMEGGCDPRTQADKLALAGNFDGAAQIYRDTLHEPQKALQLYQRAENWQEAAQTALQAGWLDQARIFFTRAGDLVNLAALSEQMQDWLQAAEHYRALGNRVKAAENYERGGDLRKALELFREAGDALNCERLENVIPTSAEDIDRMIARGETGKAARKLVSMGELRRAIGLFKELGQTQDELAQLRLFNEKTPEPWSLERQTQLARQAGEFLLEADTFRRMGQPANAAYAYLRAARQAEQRTPEQEKRIGDMYLQAKTLFEQEGYNEEAQQCWARIIIFHHKPWILLEGSAAKPFRENEFNMFELSLTNAGGGLAKTILVQPLAGGRFEVDQQGTKAIIPALAPQKTQTIPLYIRPLKEQVGENVPFVLEWSWRDRDNLEYHQQINTPVVVVARDEAHTGNTPLVINADKYIVGDYINGDQVEHKGHKIEINRANESGIRMVDGREQKTAQLLCPNCSIPVEAGSKFCDHCQHPLDG